MYCFHGAPVQAVELAVHGVLLVEGVAPLSLEVDGIGDDVHGARVVVLGV